jgi:predicted N-acetyltransferase YhbS
MPSITYKLGNQLNLDQVLDVYRASTLGNRRPVDDRERMQAMLENANLVVSAWDGEVLVGLARAITDKAFVTYLADLTVRESHQKQGIGKELIRRVQQAGDAGCKVLLLAAPGAEEYYGHIGFTRNDQAWLLGRDEELR